MKGEGKKPKFGECVRARERGESFTRNVHRRYEKVGAFLDLAGEKRAKVGGCFRFPSSSFELRSIGALAAMDRWEEIDVRDGNGVALCSMGRGCSEYGAVWRKHSAQRHCEALRAVSLQFVRFLCFLSTPERKPPCFLLSYENL